ncbi:unnamed protein product [Kuraishia capsulata CBS 1993]|uniref:Stc1 domain-containing protein n=1 Tax=Kuraishia capsulata CBS 1993 TaxID=1382522 RepID=W6MIS7_9ASCO|nr:uncharacterized protein KUCA_T00000247001 [Kuraishia capsulata CBS 1993]CDK24287.1 unnamed protein product [Kuraishia capsulata CBS 1993]
MDETEAVLQASEVWNEHLKEEARAENVETNEAITPEPTLITDQGGAQHPDHHVLGVCSRCKKTFIQSLDKFFRLCSHCRELQRERSKRWQMRTKEKVGACRRCGVDIDGNNDQFVLCASCRMNLRARKSTRAVQGKCVHCSGPNDSRFQYKVCSRCRQNDKIRRSNLERQGACNRCAKPLEGEDKDRKVCSKCRTRKKRGSVKTPGSKKEDDSLQADGSSSLSHAAIVAAAAAVMANEQPISLNISDNIQHFLPGESKDDAHNTNESCVKCGETLTIEDVNLNPGSNICAKCLESENNLFMNPEAEDITSKR